MDAFKGVFRRATQSVKEKVGSAEATDDVALAEAAKRVRNFERAGVLLSEKITKLSKAMEDTMVFTREFAEAFKGVAEGDMSQLADEILMVSNEGSAKVVELQKGLRDCFDNIGVFLREVPKLREAEEDRKKKQLEFDFFKTKVAELKKDPPKDYTRIPRNEQILENWRVELWKSTESMKLLLSNLYSGGQRSIDIAAYSVAMTLSNLWSSQLNSAKLHFVNARLPVYSPAPLLPPAPLPPNPFPPWVPPMYVPPGATAQPAAAAPAQPGVQPGAWPPQQPGAQAPPNWQQQPGNPYASPQQQQPPYNAAQQQPYNPAQQQHPQYAQPPQQQPQYAQQQYASPQQQQPYQQQPQYAQSPGAGYATPQQAASPPQQQQWQSPPQQQQPYQAPPGLPPHQAQPANPYTATSSAPTSSSHFQQSFAAPGDGAVAPAPSFAGPSGGTAFDAAVPPPPPPSN